MTKKIRLMAKSMQIVEQVFILVKTQLNKKAWTEKALASYIKRTGFKLGAEDLSFPVIVASGANAAEPHHVPDNKKIKAGESVVVDFGFKYQGYVSDFTRTIFLKFAPPKLAKAYRQTELAYLDAIKYINIHKYPVNGGKVHEVAVRTLAQKKLDKYFIHSVGHGSGLQIHQAPRLSPKSKDKLLNGMVFSIEPGVYFPGVGGIRIEDLVYLKGGKCHKFINISTKLEDNIITSSRLRPRQSHHR